MENKTGKQSDKVAIQAGNGSFHEIAAHKYFNGKMMNQNILLFIKN